MLTLLPSLFSSLLPALAGLAVIAGLVWIGHLIRQSQRAGARDEEIRQIKIINANKDKFNVQTQKQKAESAGDDNDRNRGFWQ